MYDALMLAVSLLSSLSCFVEKCGSTWRRRRLEPPESETQEEQPTVAGDSAGPEDLWEMEWGETEMGVAPPRREVGWGLGEVAVRAERAGLRGRDAEAGWSSHPYSEENIFLSLSLSILSFRTVNEHQKEHQLFSSFTSLCCCLRRGQMQRFFPTEQKLNVWTGFPHELISHTFCKARISDASCVHLFIFLVNKNSGGALTWFGLMCLCRDVRSEDWWSGACVNGVCLCETETEFLKSACFHTAVHVFVFSFGFQFFDQIQQFFVCVLGFFLTQ